MLNNDKYQSIKRSAADVYDKANICVQSNRDPDEVISKTELLIFSRLHKHVGKTIMDKSCVPVFDDLPMKPCNEKRIIR